MSFKKGTHLEEGNAPTNGQNSSDTDSIIQLELLPVDVFLVFTKGSYKELPLGCSQHMFLTKMGTLKMYPP